MWQPDIKFETAMYPAGGVAPSTYTLAPAQLHSESQGPAAPSIREGNSCCTTGTPMAFADWHIKGAKISVCNCNYGCCPNAG